MTQNIGDLLERRSLLQKSACHAVTKDVDACPGPATTLVGLFYNTSHDTRADRLTAGGYVTDEYRAAGCLRSLAIQVIGDRPTGLGRQRKDIGPS